MSRIHLKYQHALGRKNAAVRVKRFVAEMGDEYDFDSEWDGYVLHLSRTGAKGVIQVLDDAVEVDLKLGVMLMPFNSVIEERIASHLERMFPQPA